MSTSIKTRRTLLASALRIATTASAQQKDSVQQCIRVYLNISAASGSGGLKVLVRGYDLPSGVAGALNTGGAAAIVAVGMYIYELMPSSSAAAGAVQETVARSLPCVWDVQVTHGDASNYTYSVGVEVFPG